MAFSTIDFFLDESDRKLMEEDFLGDVELREIPILPFLLLSSEPMAGCRCKSSSHQHHLPIGGRFALVHHRLWRKAPKLSCLLPAV